VNKILSAFAIWYVGSIYQQFFTFWKRLPVLPVLFVVKSNAV